MKSGCAVAWRGKTFVFLIIHILCLKVMRNRQATGAVSFPRHFSGWSNHNRPDKDGAEHSAAEHHHLAKKFVSTSSNGLRNRVVSHYELGLLCFHLGAALFWLKVITAVKRKKLPGCSTWLWTQDGNKWLLTLPNFRRRETKKNRQIPVKMKRNETLLIPPGNSAVTAAAEVHADK